MVYYNFDQYLCQPKKDKGVGLFGRFGASDGNPNLMHYFYELGFGGKGLGTKRPYARPSGGPWNGTDECFCSHRAGRSAQEYRHGGGPRDEIEVGVLIVIGLKLGRRGDGLSSHAGGHD